jgi:hypothetical protein
MIDTFYHSKKCPSLISKMRLEKYPYFDLNFQDSTAIGAQWKKESSL